MDLAVKINFDNLVSDEQEWVLASFRNEVDGEGWSIRLKAGIIEVVGVPGYFWINAFIGATGKGSNVEWHVLGARHELWMNGVPISEGMSAVSMPSDGQLRIGIDPQFDALQFPYVVTVEI